jgi:hypothetical protein
MDKIPYLFSQDIITASIVAARHGDPDLLKLPGKNPFFARSGCPIPTS